MLLEFYIMSDGTEAEPEIVQLDTEWSKSDVAQSKAMRKEKMLWRMEVTMSVIGWGNTFLVCKTGEWPCRLHSYNTDSDS